MKEVDLSSTPEAVFTPLTDAELTDLQYSDIQATRATVPIKIHRSVRESSKSFTWIQTLYGRLCRQPNDVACPPQKALHGDIKSTYI